MELGGRLAKLERAVGRKAGEAFADADVAAVDATGDGASGGDLTALFAADQRRAQTVPAQVERTREKLVEAGNTIALRSLRVLRDRLGKGLRRARIGRIDAVMGSKHRVEIQIESLAAGRFPPELLDPLRVQGLLRDDEEYWPFEGELWEDEFLESSKGAD